MITVSFENRDFSPYIPEHWETLEVGRYSKNAVGGCKRATLTATGSPENMWEFVEMLRCPVYLFDTERAERVWWGLIHGVSVDTKNKRASIDCRGWWHTLDWQYLVQAKGLENYEELGSHYGREIAEDSRPTAAQSFQLDSSDAWAASSIWLRVQSVGTRADNFQVDLWDDSGDTPNATLTLGVTAIAWADMPTSPTWTEFVLTQEVTLQPATTYWIHISASAAADQKNYYIVGGNENQGYANGKCLLWDGSDWDEEWPDDLSFRVVGEAETTTQISDAIGLAGQFFLGTNIDDSSGISSEQYRDGDATTLYEIKKLLEVGTTNDRRMLANVTDTRILEVYEEPPRGEADYYMVADVVYGVDLDSMANNLTIAYTYKHDRLDTAYSLNTESSTEFGTKDLQITAREISGTQATQLRDTELAKRKYPVPSIRIAGGDVEIFDENDKPVPLSDCPVAVWVRLKDVIPGSANTSRLSEPSIFFVEEAEYNPSNNTYRIMKTRDNKPFITTETEPG